MVGSSNRFAHAVSLAVAEVPAKAYNPLFIYGGVGLGKTHLMHAIGHYAHELYPDMRILYITSEDFTNQLVSAMQTNQNQQFRERFRSSSRASTARRRSFSIRSTTCARPASRS